ncbi:MAG: hypothetical protein ACI9FO_000604 [Methylophagaceae bacterium]|jgi:hypothetical protein
MADNTISTLGQFLHRSGAKYRVFDIGRRVVKISAEEFVNFEKAKKPYPYPLNKQALFGLVFWNPEYTDKQYVWFLKLPLDEQGLLVQAARDEFLVMLLERVGECMLATEDGKNIESALKDSPYTFVPQQQKMAAFNAQVTKCLNMPASAFYDAALAYFTGITDNSDWQALAMQGIADVAIRLADDGEETIGLIATLPNVPKVPWNVFSTYLENAEPVAGIVEVLAQRLNMELQEKPPDIDLICACLRAASNSPARGLVDSMVKRILKHSCSRNIEVLATITGRIWRVLEQEVICQVLLEQLARNDNGQEGFNQLIVDVLYLPGMRPHIMKALRSPQRSKELTVAVGKLFS